MQYKIIGYPGDANKNKEQPKLSFISKEAAPIIKKPAIEYGLGQYIYIAIHGRGMNRFHEHLAQGLIDQCYPDKVKKRPVVHHYFAKTEDADGCRHHDAET
jgi:hypothetical protein